MLQKEWKELFRDSRILFLSAVAMLLLLFALVNSRSYYYAVQTQHQEAKAHARNIWVSQDDKNPHSAAHFGTYAFKPKYPLALLDQGIDKYAGISVFLEAHNRNEAEFAAAADQTGLSRFGDLTPDFILLFLLPLFIILTGYNLVSRERELGAFQLVKSQGFPLWKWVLTKWAALLLPVTAITVGIFGTAALFLHNLKDYGQFQAAPLLVMAVVYFIYYAIFTNLTILISAWSRRSGVALLWLLVLWMGVCLGMPKLAANLAESQYPFPGRAAFADAVKDDIRNGLDGHNPWSQAAKQFEKETLAKYGVDSIHQLPFNFEGYRMQKGEEHEAAVYFKHYDLLRQQYEKQSNLYRKAALISPFLPVRFASMALARSDYAAHWDFADAAEKYRLEMVRILNTDLAENSKYDEWDYKAGKELWEQVPDFSFTPPTFTDVLSRQKFNFLTLAIWFMVSFGAMIWSANKL